MAAAQHVLRKYDIQQKLGKGAYAVVFKGVDKKSKNVIAMKKIFDAFQNATDAQRTFREIMCAARPTYVCVCARARVRVCPRVRAVCGCSLDPSRPVCGRRSCATASGRWHLALLRSCLLTPRYLQALTGHENIIRLQNVLKAENDLARSPSGSASASTCTCTSACAFASPSPSPSP